MSTFENNDPEKEQEPVQQDDQEQQFQGAETQADQHAAPEFDQTPPQQETYQKRSPYADSPYVMHPGAQEYSPARPKIKKARKGAGKRILAAVLALVVVAGGCGITAFAVNNYWEGRMAQMSASLNEKINALESQIDNAPGSGDSVSGSPVASQEGGLTPSQVYARNVQSVVAISNEATQRVYGQVTETASSGSGFILTEDGYIVTNYHVVSGADRLTVITSDGTEYEAQYIGGDENNDLAVLKIEAEGLPTVTLGSSDDLIVGDQVVAIGNPLGQLTATQTVGYVSGKDRDVTTDGSIINMLQTDAAINPGNSGGPLFNMKGEVVGITTAKYSGTTSSGASIEGIGFAIPIDDVKGMISDLVEYGYVTGAYLGVVVQNVEESVKAYGVPSGAFVREVTPGFCAEAAGIQEGDIILDLGGYSVSNITDLTRALRHFDAGDTVTVTVSRSGQQIVLEVTLSEKPQDTASTQPNTDTENVPEAPEEGDYEEWFDYFWRFFNGEGNNQG
ncbi:MAG TPA: trypsin-like peptidase domain-containing protein [Candidatus Faecousia intestinigallinarum]|nr:trypsin-like peptidase domain-containing protein [Candidatus Faecousia intestinigallinarum]